MIKLTNLLKEDEEEWVNSDTETLKPLIGKTIKMIDDKHGGLEIIFEDGAKLEAFVMDQGDTGLTYNIE